MAVDRCICHDVTFAELLQLAKRDGLGFESIRRQTGCATSCARCEPYIRLSLRTGLETLPILSEEEQARILSEEANEGV